MTEGLAAQALRLCREKGLTVAAAESVSLEMAFARRIPILRKKVWVKSCLGMMTFVMISSSRSAVFLVAMM